MKKGKSFKFLIICENSLALVILEPGPNWWRAVTLTNRLTGVVYWKKG